MLTYNTFLYEHNLNNCCVLGCHGATQSANGNGNQQIQTYVFASWPEENIFPPGWADVLPLSHEVSEWMNDPMEVVAHPDFPVTIGGFTYHPQTEAILPRFTRESPSSAIDGAYSYPDTTKLTSPSQSCH